MSRFVSRFVNRNPRNLELLGVQRFPTGYQYEVNAPQMTYVYRVELDEQRTHTEAKVVHHSGRTVVSVSTREPALAAKLVDVSRVDTNAARVVGLLLGERALRAGLTAVTPRVSTRDMEKSLHQAAFHKALTDAGVSLEERFEPSDAIRRRSTWSRPAMLHGRQTNLDETYP